MVVVAGGVVLFFLTFVVVLAVLVVLWYGDQDGLGGRRFGLGRGRQSRIGRPPAMIDGGGGGGPVVVVVIPKDERFILERMRKKAY